MTVRVVLTGEPTALAAALDRIHVHCDVQAAVETDVELDLFVDGPLPDLGDLGIEIREVPLDDREWTGFESDGPVFVAEDLLIRPPWVERPAGFEGVELIVPRGMAFGSGEHGSTQAALLALREVGFANPVDVCIDVGTGSGVLAAYAQARGAHSILACDIEPESVEAARLLLPKADVRLGGPESFEPACADLVIANLDARQLGEGIDAIVGLWRRTAPLVLSGMRPGEVAPIVARVAATECLRLERAGFVAVAFVT